MTSATKEYCVGIGMLIIAVVGWFVVIPAGIDLPSSVEFRALSPDFWPHVVMILLGICGAIVAVQAHFDRQRVGDSIEAATEEVKEHFATVRNLALFIAAARETSLA